eukprot:22911-Alexandrium_andersonii.AAC.1
MTGGPKGELPLCGWLSKMSSLHRRISVWLSCMCARALGSLRQCLMALPASMNLVNDAGPGSHPVIGSRPRVSGARGHRNGVTEEDPCVSAHVIPRGAAHAE